MTYFQDFTVCTYFDAFGDRGGWLCRLIAIGWLEKGHAFATGPTPIDLVKKLQLLREDFSRTFSYVLFRGLHSCSLCEGEGRTPAPLEHSSANLFIPFQGLVFAAPGRIDHYVETHFYGPPNDFVTAVMACPLPSTLEFRGLARRANRNQDAPLFDNYHVPPNSTVSLRMDAVKAQFEVTGHHELAERGAFVVGHIRDGTFRIGMKVRTRQEPASLTISGIEYLDNLAERKFWNALVFGERPTLEFVKRAFPIGTFLQAEDSTS